MRKKNWSYMYRQQLPLGLREAIFNRDNRQCQLCGYSEAEGAKLELDHITPIAADGQNDPDNLWTLCKACNQWKRDRIINPKFLESAVPYNYVSSWDIKGNITGVIFHVKEKSFNRLKGLASCLSVDMYDLVCFIFFVYIPKLVTEAIYDKTEL